MKVINSIGVTFTEHCNALADKVIATGFHPDVVVGILTGGAFVARIMAERFKNAGLEFAYAETKLQRYSTIKKEQLGVKRHLRKLPRWVCDFLRNVEVYFREIKFYGRRGKPVGAASLSEQVRSVLLDGAKVLIVDDTIDTGVTIKAIKQGVLAKYPHSDVRLAALTITHHKPEAWPEYHVYNRVLLRFPWSYDAENGKEGV